MLPDSELPGWESKVGAQTMSRRKHPADSGEAELGLDVLPIDLEDPLSLPVEGHKDLADGVQQLWRITIHISNDFEPPAPVEEGADVEQKLFCLTLELSGSHVCSDDFY